MTQPSTRIARIAICLAVAATLTGCNGILGRGIAGSGQEASEPREVGAFDRIDVAGQTDVTVEPGDTSVTVRGDDNLLSDVLTEVNDDTLEIRERSPLLPRAGLVVEVTTSHLNGAALQGSGDMVARDVAGDTFNATVAGSGGLDIDGAASKAFTATINGSGWLDVNGFTGETFSANVSGSGGVRASGQVGHLDVTVSGSGDAQLQDLAARRATVDVTGSGGATVQVSETLDASSSGSGDVVYSGNPRNVQEQTSGSGDVRPQ